MSLIADNITANDNIHHKKMNSLTLWFDEINAQHVDIVGGKNAGLGELNHFLTESSLPVVTNQKSSTQVLQGLETSKNIIINQSLESAEGIAFTLDDKIRVPYGFCTTAFAYRHTLQQAGISDKLNSIINTLDRTGLTNLKTVGEKCRQLILDITLPEELKTEISLKYQELGQRYGDKNVDVAVRSSATAEDLPHASFAGQQESFLNVTGIESLLASCVRCFASLYTDRAISYRERHGFQHQQVALSIGIQKMVRGDTGSSGVMFTCDPESGNETVVTVSAGYGLGENVVQGNISPDEWLVHKSTLLKGFPSIIRKYCGSKAYRMVYDNQQQSTGAAGTSAVANTPVTPTDAARFSLTDHDVLQLAFWGVKIENHYSHKCQRLCPMDIEFCKDGCDGKLYIVQARPETVTSRRSQDMYETYHLKGLNLDHIMVAKGQGVGRGCGVGSVRFLHSMADSHLFQPGEVLVARRTDPDWEPILNKAAGIITLTGGRTCHAAIIAREMGIPAVVGCGSISATLTDGDFVTVSCCEGDSGKVYKGAVPFEKEQHNIRQLSSQSELFPTKVYVTLSNPHSALSYAALPCAGVGLVRIEFTIASMIKIHPMALLDYNSLLDEKLKLAIDNLTSTYRSNDKSKFFVDQLSSSIGVIAASFYPRPVIVRFSDFKTNEYRSLLGGLLYEPQESNPMLGWRGASRYYHPNYQRGFALECQAMKRVRDGWGLTNVIPMIPFCRTPAEGTEVLTEMSRNGLQRGINDLKVFMMCEVPSNVILIDEFCNLFDGMSIGSNDLCQLVLGVDRDSMLLKQLFDERSAAVTSMISSAIVGCRLNGLSVGICGQAPSDYPEFAQWLVHEGIHTMSLNPDSVIPTMETIIQHQQSSARATRSGTANSSLGAIPFKSTRV